MVEPNRAKDLRKIALDKQNLRCNAALAEVISKATHAAFHGRLSAEIEVPRYAVEFLVETLGSAPHNFSVSAASIGAFSSDVCLTVSW